jgi:TrmH family RNA methyltransferase
MTPRRPSAPATERALFVGGPAGGGGPQDRGAAAVDGAAAAGDRAAATGSAPDVFAGARDDPALVVLEGFHALKHALRFGAAVEAAATSDPDGLAALARELAPDVAAQAVALAQPVTRERLRQISPRLPHTEVVAVARRPAFSPAAVLAARADRRPVVLLEDPRHLGNVGAVVRVAAAADAAAVVTTGPRDPWDPAAVRGAAGLHFALPVGSAGADTRSALDALAGAGDAVAGAPNAGAPGAGAPAGDAGAGAGGRVPPRPLVALDPDGEPLGTRPLPAGAVLAFGTERHGLSDALLARADHRLAIPMRAGVSSLNLATAVSAVLFAGRLG